MLRTVQGEINEQGQVRLLEEVRLNEKHRALITILDDETSEVDAALLSEPALADWNRPEEEEAWAHLQPGR